MSEGPAKVQISDLGRPERDPDAEFMRAALEAAGGSGFRSLPGGKCVYLVREVGGWFLVAELFKDWPSRRAARKECLRRACARLAEIEGRA